MDGMFYRSRSEDSLDLAEPSTGVARLLLITMVAATAIVGGMLLLGSAGMNLTLPAEFPAMAPGG